MTAYMIFTSSRPGGRRSKSALSAEALYNETRRGSTPRGDERAI